MTIMKRGSTYHLRKRVPRRYEGVEERKSIWVSLHTDSLTVAQQKAPIAWQHIVEGWEARLAGDTSDAEKRFEAARISPPFEVSATCPLRAWPSCPAKSWCSAWKP